jgi:hypothetical protein
MRILLRLVLLAAVIALGYWLWTVCFPPPEKILRRQLQGVAACASFGPDEGALAKAANAEKLGGYFSPDVKIHFDTMDTGQHSLEGRDEVVQAAYAVRSQLTNIRVKFEDIAIALGADKESATVELTARANARGQDDYFISEMRFTFKKIDGQWLIIRVETVKALS